MDIKESEHKMKQEWYHLYQMVYLFKQIEEGVDSAEGVNTPTQVGKYST